MTRPRIGAFVGGTSIAFSLLCFAIVPAFTPAFVLALLFGATSAGLAFALQARRSALVALVFGLAPLCELLLIQYVVERVGSSYVALAPLALALIVAVWALTNYLRARRGA